MRENGLVGPDATYVSREIFVSPDVYQREMKDIFARHWLFVGHEDQVRRPGDFFLSSMGEEPVILNRDQDGKIHVFHNSCRHRGMRVCRYDEGNTAEFTCPYHGWSYGSDGKLIGVPHFRDCYQGRLEKANWGLIETPHVHNFRGTIWAAWDKDVPAFEEWISDMAYFLGHFLELPDGSEGDWECLGGVLKWEIPCNWKWGAENFTGDNYHNISHQSVDGLELSPSGRKGRHQGDVTLEKVMNNFNVKVSKPEVDRVENKGVLVNASVRKWGHSARGILWDDDYPYVSQWGRYPEVDKYFASAYEQRQRRLGKKARFFGHGGTIFPNMSWSDGRMSIAVWHPRGPHKTEVWRWFLVPKDAPKIVKDVMRHYAMVYAGPAGLTEQDDMENWNYAHEGCLAPETWKHPFNYELGTPVDPKLMADWSFRDAELSPGISEHNQRGFYQYWNRVVVGAPSATGQASRVTGT